MKDIAQKTLGEIVTDNYNTAAVFQSNGIDFCCKGNRVLEDVCIENDIAIAPLTAALNEARQQGSQQSADYNTWPLDLLLDVIVKKHHAYVEEQIPILKQFLQKLCDVHGERHPELFEIKALFEASAGELTTHMKREELMLFPFIRKLTQAKGNKAAMTASPFGAIENPVSVMMAEHENEGERFRKISALSQGYTPPADACNTYRTTYVMLKAFEEDLHLHIHLENNMVFPRAIALEKALT